MNRLIRVASGILPVLVSGIAWAGEPGGRLPEPGTFELLALGGVVAAVVAIRNWRRK